MNLNKAQIIGNLTSDPEARTTPSGKTVVTFSVATNYEYKDANGQKHETVTFHRCVAWAGTGETIAKWIKKGHGIYVEGRIDNRSYEKKDGAKGYVSEIIVEKFQFGSKSKNEALYNQTQQGMEDGFDQGTSNVNEVKVEDIPF